MYPDRITVYMVKIMINYYAHFGSIHKICDPSNNEKVASKTGTTHEYVRISYWQLENVIALRRLWNLLYCLTSILVWNLNTCLIFSFKLTPDLPGMTRVQTGMRELLDSFVILSVDPSHSKTSARNYHNELGNNQMKLVNCKHKVLLQLPCSIGIFEN